MRREAHIRIEVVDAASPHLDDVIALGDANRRTLGHFPRGAFRDRANRRQILAALGNADELLGYVLYRENVRVPVAKIVHFCVDESTRGQGVAQRLFDELRERVASLAGIGLWCRDDYEEATFWPHLGFVERDSRIGKSGLPLTYWYFDYEHPNLFTYTQEEAAQRQVAVLDANVFYDLVPGSHQEHGESDALRADWLQDEIEFVLTDEIIDEIDRTTRASEREQALAETKKFAFVETRREEVARIEADLTQSFAPDPDTRTASDMRHIAHAIAAQVGFFVTRDGFWLALTDQIAEQYGIVVVGPMQLVQELDELLRAGEYAPSRLASANMTTTRMRATEEDEVLNTFLACEVSERRHELRDQLGALVAQTRSCRVDLVRDDRRLLALVCYDHTDPHMLQIPLLRLANDNLAYTVAVHLLTDAVLVAARAGKRAVVVTESHIPSRLGRALRWSTYSSWAGVWSRITMQGTATMTELAERLANDAGLPDTLHDALAALRNMALRGTQGRPEQLWQLEGAVWPLKIRDLDVPCQVIPIRPSWAIELFDTGLADVNLFGGREDLLLNRENVYYSAAAPGSFQAPGRVLWYVSRGDTVAGGSHMRACSRVLTVKTGAASALFGEFKRLGVYKWEDVLRLANGDPSAQVTAVRFSDTELLPHPIPWSDLKSLLPRLGENEATFQWPRQVSPQAFVQLYRVGQGYSPDEEIDDA